MTSLGGGIIYYCSWAVITLALDARDTGARPRLDVELEEFEEEEGISDIRTGERT